MAQDRLPASSCKLQHAEYVAFQDSWNKLSSSGIALPTYLNYHCLETNAIESVLQFNAPVWHIASSALYAADDMYRLPSGCHKMDSLAMSRCPT